MACHASHRQQFAADQHDGAHRRDADRQPAQAFRVQDAGSARATARSRPPPRGSAARTSPPCRRSPNRSPRARRPTCTEPTRKNPLIVPRSCAPLLRCHTSAIGGPPIAVAVPSRPDAAPASSDVAAPRRPESSRSWSKHDTAQHDGGEQQRQPPFRQHRQQQRARDRARHPADQRPPGARQVDGLAFPHHHHQRDQRRRP